NVFGNKNASLTPALGSFFDSLRALSVDASSEVLRNQVLNEGQTLASRFNGLATQLDGLDLETRKVAEDRVATFNVLTEQLASINSGLQKSSDVARQPASLLDSRDQVLRQMAEITRISVREQGNGSVTVGIGTSSTTAVVVDGLKSVAIGVNFLSGTPNRSELQLNPFEDPVNLSGLIGGELGGVLAFRDQMLAPAMAKLDDIASTFMGEINTAHAKGMDMAEQAGIPLFAASPEFAVDYSMADGSTTLSVSVDESGDANLRPINLAYDAPNTRWVAEDTLSGLRYASSGSPQQLTMNGLTISLNGQAQAGDVLSISGEFRASRSIAVAIEDPKSLAAGDLFRVSQSVSNISDTSASIRLVENAVAEGSISSLDSLLVNNLNIDAALTVSTSYSLAKMILPAGTSNLQLSMNKSTSSDAELQVFTRNGRHLFGSELTDAQQSVMLSEQNGFVSGTTYSNDYLNGAAGYTDQSWSLGSSAKAVIGTLEDGSLEVKAEALLRGGALPSLTNSGTSTMTVIADGALKLDGIALPALELVPGASLTSSAVASWLNTTIASDGLALSASAQNEIRIPVNDISTTTGALTINNVSVHSATAIESTTALVNNINAQSSNTNVQARLDFDGALILTNTAGFEDQTISLGSSSAVFTGISGDIQAGIAITATRSAGDTSDRTVALTLSETGSASDLAKLGFATTLEVPNTLSEDLIVFTTGSLGNTAALSASYEKGETDPLQLRSSPLQINFTSDATYQITDTQTSTIVAERSYVAGQPIQ
ncbi:MAG: hypothetical protein L7S71_06315, partial [Pseudomonadales bacterium]|nr:hypothetical protein [Pseudomonadales bacterium]